MPTEAITVRAAGPGDAAAMAEVHVAAWRTGYAGLLPADFLDGLTVAGSVAQWTAALTDGDSPASTIVAEVTGTVVGISSFGPYRCSEGEPPPLDLSELWMLNVHPDSWGTGVAQRLMDTALDGLLTERQEPRSALWVLEGNDRGRRFYEKQGWSADGGTKQVVFGGADAVEVRYSRTL